MAVAICTHRGTGDWCAWGPAGRAEPGVRPTHQLAARQLPAEGPMLLREEAMVFVTGGARAIGCPYAKTMYLCPASSCCKKLTPVGHRTVKCES